MYYHHTQFRTKNSLFVLGSILLHLTLFFILSVSNLGIKKSPRRDQFELNAIKVANLLPAAKNRFSTKGDTRRKGEQVRKKSTPLLRKRRKITPSKKTDLAKISHQQPKSTPKQIRFKVTKKITMLEKTIRQQKYTINRKPVTKQQLKTEFNVPKVKTYQETTTSLERVTKVRTVARRGDPQIKTKTWQQNVTQKQMDKRLKPVKPTIQRQAVAKQQLKYQPRNKNQPLELVQTRITYKQQSKELNRRVTEEPKPVKVTEPVEQIEIIKHITKFRRVIKKTTVVTRVEPLSVLKDSLALEEVPLKTYMEKENKRVNLTPQREVTIKKMEYEERIDSAEPIKVSQARVTYEQKSAELSKKVMATPEMATELTPTEPETAMASVTTVAKQESDSYPTMAHTLTTSLTQLPTAINAENQKRAEKMTTFSNTLQTSTKTSLKRRLNTQKTATFPEQVLAFKDSPAGITKGIQPDSFSTPLTDMSTSGSSGGSRVKIEANLPEGYITTQQLYRLTGIIDSDVKTAFLTVNEVTQLITVVDGTFVAEVALAKGINNLNIMAFNSKGKMGRRSFRLLFNAPVGGVPIIGLDSPENGRQGVKQGEPVLVAGTIDDPTISKATLLLNQTPIPLKVKNGRFYKKITLPAGTIFVFRIMAQNESGVRGFSPTHTILATYDIDILNPRPY